MTCLTVYEHFSTGLPMRNPDEEPEDGRLGEVDIKSQVGGGSDRSSFVIRLERINK